MISARKLIAAGCALVAAVALYLTFFNASDEDRIKKVLGALSQTIAVKEGDTIISRTARLRGDAKDLVDDDIHVDVSDLNVEVRGRQSFADEAAKIGLFYQKADCDFTNVRVRLDAAATTASVDADAIVTANRGGQQQRDRRAVHFLLRKDGGWKVATIDVAGASSE